MSYQTRILPPDEWPKLAGTDLQAIWPRLNSAEAHVIVVEQGPTIVAHWLVLPVYHVECLWIHPDHQKRASVARRLWIGMRRLLADLGRSRVMTAAVSDDVRGLLAHVGAEPVPGDHYMLTVEETPCHPL